MGEICVAVESDVVISCLGIGSCIALCMFDPVKKVGGMAHIVLPECPKSEVPKLPGKFANTAIPEMLGKLTQLGAAKSRLIVKLVGGAQMIQAEGFGMMMQMGQRNQEMTRRALKEAGLSIASEDVGGSQGRSVWLYIDSGRVVTKTAYGSRCDL
jgi:chemotaxis protein CheD